jgi:hypothetical protein
MHLGKAGSKAALLRQKILFVLANTTGEIPVRDIHEIGGWARDNYRVDGEIATALTWMKRNGLVEGKKPDGYRCSFWKISEQGRIIFAGEYETEELPIAIPGGQETYPVIPDVLGEPVVRFVGVDEDLTTTEQPLGVLVELTQTEALLSPDDAEQLANRLRQAAARARFEQEGRSQQQEQTA